MAAAGHGRPILVGGAVVELYTGNAMASGDFDVVTGRQDAFDTVLAAHGFARPSGPSVATRVWVHPDLALGLEVVSAMLLDGLADRDRLS